MSLSLKPKHLKRYKDIALLIFRYGNGSLVRQFGLEEALGREESLPPEEARKPEQLAEDLEGMGPTFVKLGQFLSCRSDLLPLPYLQALSRLHEDVAPFPFEEVEETVQAELGVRISKAFSLFNSAPLAAASLGQVHEAALRDGRPVAVKVQRPGIRAQVLDDLEVLQEIAEFLDNHTEMGRRYQIARLLAEVRKGLLEELDYRKEASQLRALAGNLAEFRRIRIPAPVDDYTTARVLTMEYISGRKITDLSPLAGLEIDGVGLADELFQAYLKQVLVDGFFHADPHPGNVYLTDDHRIALLDLGMVGRVGPQMQESLLQLLLAISEGEAERAGEVIVRISEKQDGFQEKEFQRWTADLVLRKKDASLDQIEIGRIILDLVRAASDNGLRVDPDLTLLGKTLLQLDQIGRILSPAFNPAEAVRRHAADIVQQRAWKSISPGQIFASLLETKEFIGRLPGRLNKLLDAVTRSEIEIKVRTLDTDLYLEGIQKVANRITAGLILAALIIGAALLMRVDTPFRVFGYPGFAMLCFLAAAGGGFWLVLNIFFQDHRDKKKRRP